MRVAVKGQAMAVLTSTLLLTQPLSPDTDLRVQVNLTPLEYTNQASLKLESLWYQYKH